jgi:hypothetical protein
MYTFCKFTANDLISEEELLKLSKVQEYIKNKKVLLLQLIKVI